MVLPTATLTIQDDGTVTVNVDGMAMDPDPTNPPWRRESVPILLDSLSEQWPGPIRIELHEADGSVFTDIVVPSEHRDPTHAPASVDPITDNPEVPRSTLVPGEEVAVAVIIGHGRAEADGSIRGLSSAVQNAASASGEVVLIGRASGAHIIRPKP